MKGSFDKTFFKFVAGFAGILTIAIVSILAVGYYEMQDQNTASTAELRTGEVTPNQVDNP